jgi:mRNA-degrading endonuclease toxin of MazEF toxin-antitoxin module
LTPGGKAKGAIISDQLKSSDWRARHAKKFDKVSEEIMIDVLAKIGALVSWSDIR